ncbi:hypothetical protein Ddc_20754 [Ditylenchus destructor]|nr:hypothetical protein Ddc_20754 [Ditylenchus destructor]
MVQSGEMSLEEFVAKQAAWMSKQVARCNGMRMTITGPASPAGRGATPWKRNVKRAPQDGGQPQAGEKNRQMPVKHRKKSGE